MSLAVAKRYLKCDRYGCDKYLSGDGKEVRIIATDFFTYKEYLTSVSILEAVDLGINVDKLRRFVQKFYKVTFKHADGARGERYVAARTPAEALAEVRSCSPACNNFRVSKKELNGLGHPW